MAFEKFIESSIPVINNRSHLVAAANAIYNDIFLPESDRKLKDALIDIWIMGSSELCATSGDFADIPDFAADLSVHLLRGFDYNAVTGHCEKCGKKVNGSRQFRSVDETGAEKREPA